MSEQRSCPDCSVIMGFADGVYFCLDPECGYTEQEEEEQEEEDDEEVFRCPHCSHVIEEGDLP